MASHATEIFKAVAGDPDATEDTKDPSDEAEEDEDDLDEVEDCFFSSSVLTKDSVADHEVAEVCYCHRYQPIPVRVT